ncbi:MAG: flavin reductase [Bacilli bacterium]|nr:flavin reductase [Bacilli bacterium]
MQNKIYQFSENIFKIVGKDSALLTAGTPSGFNTMTIGWATIGVLWGRNVLICFVRPSRYTFQFMENTDVFTVSFFDEIYNNKLVYLGSHSGRDEDKVKKCNLTPEYLAQGITFDEARLAFVCKKIYCQDLEQELIAEKIKVRYYPQGDYHRMYIGEIIDYLEK